jgi:YbbR domain-containing protein
MGKPASGYRVAAIEIAPAQVRVRAPSREIAGLQRVDAEAIDVAGMAADGERVAAITTSGNFIRIDPGEVAVKVPIAPIIATKEFQGVQVTVRNADYPARVQPPKMNVTVRGAKLELGKLNLGDALFVDGDGMTPGTYNAPVQVQLPQGVELLHLWPDKVKITIRRVARR